MAQLSSMKLTVKKIIEESRGQKIKGKNHYDTKLTAAEMGFINAYKDKIASRKPGGFVDRMVKKGMNQESYIMKGTEPRMVAMEDTQEVDEEGGGGSNTAFDDYTNQTDAWTGGSNDGGSGGGNMSKQQAMQQFGLMESQDLGALKKTAADEALKTQRESARQGYVDKFTGSEDSYESKFGSLASQYDLTGERDAIRGTKDPVTGELTGGLEQDARDISKDYQTAMTGETGFASKMGGYAGDLDRLRTGTRDPVTGKLTGGVEQLGTAQGKLGEKIGGLAEQALDPTKSTAYERNRQMLAGTAEAQRKAQSKGAQEQLMRGMAGAGSSPEQIAMAKAKLAGGQGAQARQDALSTAMGAQQMTGQQLAQGAGLYGQQAGLGMQQANLLGQQAGLTQGAAGLTGQQAGMYGQAAQFGMGAIGQRAGLLGQSAGLLGTQLQGKAGLMQTQAGMTGVGLQDIVAKSNEEMQMEMARRANAANLASAKASNSGGDGGGGFLGLF